MIAFINLFSSGTTGQVVKKNSGTAFDFGWGTDGGGFPAVESIGTGSAYTLVTGDANKIKVGVDSAAQTINITTAFNGLGCWIQWLAGAGTITLDAGAGVNLNGLGDGVNITLSQAAGMIQIIPTGTNTWNVVGAIGDLAVADVTDMSADARTFNQAANFAAMRTALGAAPLDSPNLTGTPTAPTAADGTNTAQLATTAFVQAAITALINAAPGALNTLDELAAALGDDANFATTVTNALATKATLSGNVYGGAQSVTPSTLTDGATVTPNAALSNNFRWVIGGNRTLANPTNPSDGQVINIKIKQDATGGRTITWGSAYKFPNGAAPALSSAANAVDVLTGWYDGADSIWICSVSPDVR